MRIESLNRRDFLSLAMSGAAAMTFGRCPPVEAAASSGRRPPNILLIVSDDQGYAEMGVQGCKDIPTPTLDSIAKNGVRFTNGYVSCPVCSPTRAGLMTGRYQQRFGHEFNPGPAEQADSSFGLPLNEVTVANRLKSLGYATGMVGKWHLGYKPEFHPQKRGFDKFYGFLAGSHPYLPAPGRKGGLILRGTEPVDDPPYLTEAFASEAVAFIERHQNEPFFLYLPLNAVHSPLQSTEKYLSRLAAISDPKRRTFAAMLSAMDDAIAQVLGRLRESKLEENTLIFFISDNGGPTEQTSSCNSPLRGHKGQVLEGGIRVPFMVQWKGHLPAGKVYEQPVISLDIHPTAIAAAGGKIGADAKLDGVNLIPYLTGENKNLPHDRLFWRFAQQWAIRMGDWKLEKGPERGAPELFNLAGDIGEKDNLASSQPEKVKELQAAYDTWNSQLIQPLWRQGGGRGGPGGGQRRARRGRTVPQS
jgi:arylsulfatase A-like enzyme